MTAKPRAILFDWDNTLVDTWPTIVQCYHDTFSGLGHAPWTEQEIRDRAHGSLRDFFPTVFGDRAGDAEKLYFDAFLRIHLERLTPLPGAAELLQRSVETGCYVAVVSNKTGQHLRTEMKHLGWERWIKLAVGAKDCVRDKPAPDPIFRALEGTGIAPADVWMVGDTLADLKCAHAAGCVPVLVGGPEQLTAALLEFPPRLRARNCHELAALL
ncbi:MAG TPA: HAD hydrolase-like protein [Reyranellaceae bacterium]|nr:HAD hydrolase-like protein [Reyranellaceae bacterium]